MELSHFGFLIAALPGATTWIIYTHCGDTCEYDFLNAVIINQVWARDFGFKN
jgi:hypothetical protein